MLRSLIRVPLSRVALRSSFPRFFSFPAGTVRFTKDHEWIRLSSASEASVGITDHAQHELGDVVYIELPDAGAQFKRGDAFGTVESVKATSSVYAPISFSVTEKNAKLLADNSIINKSPEKDGWMVKVKLANPDELKNLMDEAAYKQHVENSKH